MFTTAQLIQKFPKSPVNTCTESYDIHSIMEVISYVNVETGIERSDKDCYYYYKIPILDVVKSEITDEILDDMVKNGWFITKDRKYIKKTF